MDYKGRQKRLLQEMSDARLDALLITHLPNVQYLCGFTGSAGVLLVSRHTAFFTDGRYTGQAKAEVTGARVITAKGPALVKALERACGSGASRIGIEADHLTVSARSSLLSTVGTGQKLVETSGIVETLRMTKDPDEIKLVRESVHLAAHLFRPLLRSMKAGVEESKVAARLEYLARRAGAEGMSFETIVAGGERSALPHGIASRAPLPSNGFVVLDYGVILHHYCSDMTRTVHLGPANEESRGFYRAVLEAQLSGISAIRPGATVGEVDEAARSELKRSRLAKYFTHSTGHGVGLEIHETPRVAAGQQTVLEPGMVITVEPGIYIPGKCGIRIEDMVLVTGHGYEVLTPVSKQLIEI